MTDEKRERLKQAGFTIIDTTDELSAWLGVPPEERESFANRIAKSLQECLLHARGEIELKSDNIENGHA